MRAAAQPGRVVAVREVWLGKYMCYLKWKLMIRSIVKNYDWLAFTGGAKHARDTRTVNPTRKRRKA